MNNIMNYRNKHIATVIAIVLLLIEEAIHFDGIFRYIVWIIWGATSYFFIGTYEKKDESTKEILAKATNISFFIFAAAIFIVAIIIENITSISLASNLCIYTLLGAISLRSILFLIFDHTPAEKEGE